MLSGLTALQNKLKLKSATNVSYNNSDGSCSGDCASCGAGVSEAKKKIRKRGIV